MKIHCYLTVILLVVIPCGITVNADEGFAATADGNVIVAGGSWFTFRTNIQGSDWLWLHKWSEQNDAWMPFISTGRPISDVDISPTGKYVAITDFTQKADPAVHPDFTLHIYTSDNEHIASFPDIFDIVFSPDELQVAMVVGEYREGPYIPQDIIIYNIETGESYSLNHKANELFWANHDGNIYLKLGGMFPAYCYDVKTRQLNVTDYKGIFFSPDGTYYYNRYETVIQIFWE